MHRSIRSALAVVAASGLCLAGGASALAAPAPHRAPGGGAGEPIH
ncbi:MAG TPA: hypothetical protein VG123_41420 [Streptosporangiaceae bacterium]|jgi:hypothetical protein|nr:hypothetical protein [Streptosporangiaceae bacterium]